MALASRAVKVSQVTYGLRAPPQKLQLPQEQLSDFEDESQEQLSDFEDEAISSNSDSTPKLDGIRGMNQRRWFTIEQVTQIVVEISKRLYSTEGAVKEICLSMQEECWGKPGLYSAASDSFLRMNSREAANEVGNG